MRLCFLLPQKSNPFTTNIIKFSRGLKYILEGFISSQNEIVEFIENCKKLENNKGYITQNIFEILVDRKYKFSSDRSQIRFLK